MYIGKYIQGSTFTPVQHQWKKPPRYLYMLINTPVNLALFITQTFFLSWTCMSTKIYIKRLCVCNAFNWRFALFVIPFTGRYSYSYLSLVQRPLIIFFLQQRYPMIFYFSSNFWCKFCCILKVKISICIGNSASTSH